MATITIPADYDVVAIAEAAGSTDLLELKYNNGELTVDDVTQENLDNALAAYVHDPLLNYQVSAKMEVDAFAADVRHRFITTGSGQEMIYLRKEDQAEAFKTAGYPEGNLSDYPLVEAEAIAMSDTGEQVADQILAQRDLWMTAGSAIERERRLGKIIIDQQLSEAGVDSAKANALAALDAIVAP